MTTGHVRPDRDLSLQGHYAGIVTRVGAFGIDVLLASALFAIGGRIIEFVLSSVLGKEVSLSDAPVVAIAGLVTWLLVYFAYPIAVSGRTLGMATVGLEVVSKDGSGVSAGRCARAHAAASRQHDPSRDRHPDDPGRPQTPRTARHGRRNGRRLRMERTCCSPPFPRPENASHHSPAPDLGKGRRRAFVTGAAQGAHTKLRSARARA